MDEYRQTQIDTDGTDSGECGAYNLLEFKMEIGWKAKPTTIILIVAMYIYTLFVLLQSKLGVSTLDDALSSAVHASVAQTPTYSSCPLGAPCE